MPLACVHRDVKPANFLLRGEEALVLADFGLAVPAGSSDAARPGSLYGTPRYVAPEQLQGAPAQPAADVYSLGVLLHELLTGQPPFTGATLVEVLAQQPRRRGAAAARPQLASTAAAAGRHARQGPRAPPARRRRRARRWGAIDFLARTLPHRTAARRGREIGKRCSP